METAENVSSTLAEAVELQREPATEAAETKSEAQSKAMPRWVMVALATQIPILALFLWAAHTVRASLDELASRAVAVRQDVETLDKRTTALSTDTRALGAEIASLRQHMVSSAGEDEIFLKTLILKPDIDPELAR